MARGRAQAFHRAIAKTLAGGTQDLYIIGPIPPDLADLILLIQAFPSTAIQLTIAASLVRTPDKTIANMNSGQSLIDSSDTLQGNTPAVVAQGSTNTPFTLALGVPARTEEVPMYVMITITSGASVSPCGLLFRLMGQRRRSEHTDDLASAEASESGGATATGTGIGGTAN